MKGILKKTAGTGSSYWTITFPIGTDYISNEQSIFIRDYKEMTNAGASSLIVCREDAERLTNQDYDSVVEFEIVESTFEGTTTTYTEAKIKFK
jgi:hypothetical protein